MAATKNRVFALKRQGIIDRSSWAEGPWDNDLVDGEQWGDEATGLPCMVTRDPHMGHLCGYVGVYADHPFYEKDLVFDGYTVPLKVHGSINWTGFLDFEPEPPTDVALREEPNVDNLIEVLRLPLRAWCFGFDCARSGDDYPFSATNYIPDYMRRSMGMIKAKVTYRDTAYVKQYCGYLARFLAER